MRWNEKAGVPEYLGDDDDPGNEVGDELALDRVSMELFGKLFKELIPDEIRIVIRRLVKTLVWGTMIDTNHFCPDGVRILREVADEMAEKLHPK